MKGKAREKDIMVQEYREGGEEGKDGERRKGRGERDEICTYLRTVAFTILPGLIVGNEPICPWQLKQGHVYVQCTC